MDEAKARYLEGELVDVDGVTGWISAAADAVEWLSSIHAEPVSVLNERVARHPKRARLDAAAGELPGRRSYWLAGELLVMTVNVDGQIIAVVREVAQEASSAA